MARNLYSAYRASGSSAGKYKASLFEVSGAEDRMSFADKRGAWEQEKLSRNVEAIGAGLELASTIAGGLQDRQKFKGKVGALESEYGKLQADTRDWKQKGYDYLIGKERQYTFGEGDTAKTFSKAGVGARGGALLGESMLDESGFGRPDTSGASAESDIAPDLEIEELDTSDLDYTQGAGPLSNETLDVAASGDKNLLEAATGYKQGKGLTGDANKKLYEADPSMKGKSPSERVKRYEDLFGGSYNPGDYELGGQGLTNPLGF